VGGKSRDGEGAVPYIHRGMPSCQVGFTGNHINHVHCEPTGGEDGGVSL